MSEKQKPGEAIVLSRSGDALTPKRKLGIDALEPRLEDIGETSWGSITASLEAALGSVDSRTTADLVASLEQIEQLTQRLSADIGLVDEAKNLDQVHPVVKVLAQIFQGSLPALRNIVRRAELREHGIKEHARLTEVNGKLIELRKKVNEQVDELIGQSLLLENPQYEGNERGISTLAPKLALTEEALKHPMLSVKEPEMKSSDPYDNKRARRNYLNATTVDTAVGYFSNGQHYTSETDEAGAVRALIDTYASLSGENRDYLKNTMEVRRLGDAKMDMSVLSTKFRALREKFKAEMESLIKKRKAFINNKKQELLNGE